MYQILSVFLQFVNDEKGFLPNLSVFFLKTFQEQLKKIKNVLDLVRL